MFTVSPSMTETSGLWVTTSVPVDETPVKRQSDTIWIAGIQWHVKINKNTEVIWKERLKWSVLVLTPRWEFTESDEKKAAQRKLHPFTPVHHWLLILISLQLSPLHWLNSHTQNNTYQELPLFLCFSQVMAEVCKTTSSHIDRHILTSCKHRTEFLLLPESKEWQYSRWQKH